MSRQQQGMLEYTVQDLVTFLMEDFGLAMEDTMDKVYASVTFGKLADPGTGLYLQGSAYVYEFLKGEGFAVAG